jgi:hypothetical protein
VNKTEVDYNEEYFYLIRSGNRFPTLEYDDNYDGDDTEIFDETPLDTTETRIVCFSALIPHNPSLADYHFLGKNAPVISERLKNVLESMKLKDMQFLPAVILDNKDNEHEGFFIVHAYNMIRCMDKENSEWRPSPWNSENAINIEKLVLDNGELGKIPLKKRLVFALGELRTHVLYHRSVVEKILEIEPTGLTVSRLSKYDSSLPFKEEYIAGYMDDDDDDDYDNDEINLCDDE